MTLLPDPETPPFAPEPLGETTVRSRIAQRLTEHIVGGRLSPGQRLTEQQLAASLGVSRGPLREAIRDLVDTGLLTSVPYKGLYVRSMTRRDLEELYSLRTALERFAFERGWDRRTPAALEDLARRAETLRRCIDRGDDGQAAIAHELHLHGWIYEVSGHGLLARTWEGMKPNVHFYFSLHQRAHDRKGPQRQSHDLYVTLASGDDLPAMLAHLSDHMRQGLAVTLAALEGQFPPEAARP
ncbi:GntR family transcriptional regulator [Oceaniglobus roseus]|uniref:GntR family transcriptional regulator n=1 Tax=Oceaniglobus roseus TaxID=1737570 RepID=UPI001562E842|nr:GntR family transcriptional regulator [Kandeliimicrobium roseum]